ncbi:hypothetical protein ACFYRN_25275 [Streptomyces sp. NPDC005227]|uniref:hypothetical protein n=1 Tax=Streptomyces sp. NPDC005227 TaxID=3364707 RepID=UPI0036BCF7E7
MTGRLCRTADEAFAAGWDEPCDHGVDPAECRSCALTGGELARLVVLLGGVAASPGMRDAA